MTKTVFDGITGGPKEATMIDPEIADLVKTLVRQQLEILSKSSVLSRERKAMGDLKKARDGTIAELARLEVKLTEMELPFGLTVDAKGYVVAEDSDEESEDEE